MARPLKHFCYRLSRDLGIDIDIILKWPVGKVYGYVAFYMTENPEWKEKMKEESITEEQRAEMLLQVLGG